GANVESRDRLRWPGFISEWWPESNRNGGRHQIGIPGRIASEFAQVFIERPRIAELREAIIGGLPCKPQDEKASRKELRTFSDRLVICLNWAHRFVPMRKRLVQFIPGFWDSSVARSCGGNIVD